MQTFFKPKVANLFCFVNASYSVMSSNRVFNFGNRGEGAVGVTVLYILCCRVFSDCRGTL